MNPDIAAVLAGASRWAVIEGEALATLQAMPDASVDAVVTDPPWMDYTTGWYDASAWHAPVTKLSPTLYAASLFRVARANTAAIVWCRWDSFDEHAHALWDAGWTVRNQIVWAKPNHTAGDLDGNLGNQHECAVFAVKGNWKRHAEREVNLWDEDHLFTRAVRSHPTEKPIGLMRRSVRCACPPGGVVLDPFGGSMTTVAAALMEGRRAIGIEREAAYVAIGRTRCANVAAGHAPEPQPVRQMRLGGIDP